MFIQSFRCGTAVGHRRDNPSGCGYEWECQAVQGVGSWSCPKCQKRTWAYAGRHERDPAPEPSRYLEESVF